MAAIHKLPIKGTSFTVDEIVDKVDGKPCLGYPISGRCPGECPWGIFLGINASHPGAQAYYDSLHELFSQDWKVEFVKTDCWDSARKAELTVQANAVHKQPLTAGTVNGSTKPRAFALSLSGPMFHGRSRYGPVFLEPNAGSNDVSHYDGLLGVLGAG